MKHLVAHKADGSIAFYVSIHPTNLASQVAPAGGGFIEIDQIMDKARHAKEHFVTSGVLLVKRAIGAAVSKLSFAADGKDEIVISRIPKGATATVKGVISAGPERIDDGELIITSNKKGKVNVTVKCLGYFTWRITLNAD